MLSDLKTAFFPWLLKLYFQPPLHTHTHTHTLTKLYLSLLSVLREACFGCNRLAGPLSLPWLPVSGLLVSVWVSSCRLFVDCAGRRRGGGVGVGVRRTADSCSGHELSSPLESRHCYSSSSQLFAELLHRPPPQSKSPSIITPTLSSLSSFSLLFFVLTPVTLFHCL